MTTNRPPLPEQPQMSPAARLLARHGVSAGEIAAIVDRHRTYVSHQLAGRKPYTPELLEAVAAIAGRNVAAEVATLLADAGARGVKFQHSETARRLHAAGFTLSDVAAAVGVSASAVSQVIMGRSTSAALRTAVLSAIYTVAGDDVFVDIYDKLGEGAR